jgi:REP element-mobilizing transposase RayT
MFYHFTAKSLPPYTPFADFEQARWTWAALRRNFPNAISACLMPNHLHLLVATSRPQEARIALRIVLSKMTARFYGHRLIGARIWQPVPTPVPVEGAQKIRRNVRYIVLNPCRAGLAPDPISWPWSTHLDFVGGRSDPWVEFTRLSKNPGFKAFESTQIHKYISSDPCVNVSGTPLPNPAPPMRAPLFSLQHIAMAALLAQDKPTATLTRRGPARTEFLRLAWHQGWQNRAQLRGLTHIKKDALRNTVQHPPSQAALICLGDGRLRKLALRTQQKDAFRSVDGYKHT